MTAIDDALTALSGARWTIADAPNHVPDRPGLYAIFGDDHAFDQLGVKRRKDSLLYVGKAERSLVSRELRGHFAADAAHGARTGGSTVRRSFAALLREPLGFRGIPRNIAKPGYFSNYGLSEQHDLMLTSWMHHHLTLAVWVADEDGGPLKPVEAAVIVRWAPPLNIAGNPDPAPGLAAARTIMAAEARSWSR